MNLRKAERKQAKIRLALQGPSGSGKTYSSLLIAKGLVNDWQKIVIIDTENFSADSKFILPDAIIKLGISNEIFN